MKFKINCFIMGCITALAFNAVALANPYPNHPIKLIVPWPAGGSADAVGRLLGEQLGKQLGTTVIVENVAGASATIGTQQVAKAKPDGYTLLLASSSGNASAPNLYKKINFDPIKDFSPIGLVALIPSILIVSNDSPFNSPKAIADAARKKPEALAFGSGGIGNSGHLSSELFASIANFKANHIPYQGNNPALTDLIGGRLDFMFDNGAIPHIKSERVKALGIASNSRIKALPELPTLQELGYPNMILSNWFGLAAPAQTPENIIEKVNIALNQSLQEPAFVQRLIDMGAELRTTDSKEFSVFCKTELLNYKKLIESSSAQAQ